MEYQERDVTDDEQIVEEDEHNKDNEYEEPEDKSEDEEDDEPEEEEDEEPERGGDEEKNPWVAIQDEVKERHKEKIEALITKFQEIGDSQEVAAVKAYNSLLPLYREDLRDV